jgi:hypothetical protein
MKFLVNVILLFMTPLIIFGQDYYYQKYGPFDSAIPTPTQFFGYEIGSHHTRHDQMVSYFKLLESKSPLAKYIEYGVTFEKRPLCMLIIGNNQNLSQIDKIKAKNLEGLSSNAGNDRPIIINLGYNVHGNEPSTMEAAILTAYTMIASQHPDIIKYRNESLIFIDPALNPDGRERHTQWANMYKADPLIADNDDAEHNEAWPRGRGNHYWFDLNRDWYLAIHPESRAKLQWYHQWYPQVTGDFHEMGTNSSFFFEPMKTNGSKNPIMPKENYTELNDIFAKYFVKEMDDIGSLYFTKDVFDGTYPGYGSSYGDLQGGLAILFEQASSRGHVQETPYGDLTFAFTIRNQYVCGMATIQAAVENKNRLFDYQRMFFSSALSNAANDPIKAYLVKKDNDPNKTKAFVDKLLIHKVKVYKQKNGDGLIIPTTQPQYRMVQSFFETYHQYQDSVFYDASAWSLAHFYNINFEASKVQPILGDEITDIKTFNSVKPLNKCDYAYILDWDDDRGAAALHYIQSKGLIPAVSFKPYTVMTTQGKQMTNYGDIMINVAKQKKSSDEVYNIINEAQNMFQVQAFAIPSGYSVSGIDLGSGHVRALESQSCALLIGDGTSSTEAGEVWHHFDQKLHKPLSKINTSRFKNLDINKYQVLIMVSGSYNTLDSLDAKKIKLWTSQGNTLVTIGSANTWAIKNKIIQEKINEGPKSEKPQEVKRLAFDQASEHLGREAIGGAIFRAIIDKSHPICFGYQQDKLAVYKNNSTWLQPSKNEYSNIAIYDKNPHIDGYISPKNLNDFMKTSSSVVLSQIGSGRAIMFADNPLFRASWYGTQRMFNNAIFFGHLTNVPSSNRFMGNE